MMPIMNFGISVEGKDLSQLSSYANDVLAPALKRVNGVAKVDLTGTSFDEVKIILNPDKLASFGINESALLNIIRSENMDIPGGTIKEGDYDVLVRTSNKFKSIDDIKKYLYTYSKRGCCSIKRYCKCYSCSKGKNKLF